METANYKFEARYQLESLEAQIRTDAVLVEIANFVPFQGQVPYSASHHLLASWVHPMPILGKANLGNSAPSRLFDLGQTTFIPADIPSQWRFNPEAGSRRVIIIRLAPTVLHRLGQEESCRFDADAMASCDIRDPNIQFAIKRLANEAISPGFASKTIIESVADGLLVDLARHGAHHRPQGKIAKGGLAPWQMRRIIDRIAYAVATESTPSLTELAMLVGISTGHLRRAFQQSAGCTIGAHVRNVRLEKARQLLTQTDTPIKEIAAQLCFTSQYGFTVAFQRETGETPSAFRQRARARA